MGLVGTMVRLLPIAQYRQHPLSIDRRTRDHMRHQELCLRQPQAWSVCSNRPCSRTRNANASSTNVI